jgi:hypothetical protein
VSNDADWDPDWWKKRRDESLDRKKADVGAASGVKPGDAFLIVTEGTVTEPIYFELFLETLELARVWVKVIPGRASDPRHVVETARSVAKEQVRRAKRRELGVRDPAKFDRVWAVIDTDVALRGGFWNDVKQLAAARKVMLAHSTPCFEFWLLLHLVEHATTRGDLPDGAAAKAAMKKKLGRDYSTNEDMAREAIISFIGEWPKAVIHAETVRRYHDDAATQPPCNPSTEVDRLAREMNDSAPVHLRKFK